MSTEEEYNRLLKEFANKVRTSITIRQTFDRLIKAGMKTGRTDMQIGDDIRRELKGELDDRTIRRYLPESMKHTEKTHLYLKHDEDHDPHIPPPPQEVREIEPERELQSESPQLQPKSNIVKQVFDPPMMDRNDRTQVFILHIDLTDGRIIKYETVGRRSVIVGH